MPVERVDYSSDEEYQEALQREDQEYEQWANEEQARRAEEDAMLEAQYQMERQHAETVILTNCIARAKKMYPGYLHYTNRWEGLQGRMCRVKIVQFDKDVQLPCDLIEHAQNITWRFFGSVIEDPDNIPW